MKISFDLLTLAPAVVPMAAVLLALVVDIVVPRVGRFLWAVAVLGLAGGLGALVASVARGHREAATLCPHDGGACLWQADRAGTALQAVALGSALVVGVLAWLDRRSSPGPDRTLARVVLLLAATAGSVGVVAARDLGSWLVLIELATIPSIALVALRGGRRAAHGALSLLVTAIVSFAVQVLGAAMWFAATGSAVLSPGVVLAASHDHARRPLLVVAMMLILAGVGFKLSLAPFHAWTPEAFAGSGSWVSAFLATTSKVGALGGMLVVLRAATALGSSALVPLGIVAALSMTLGNLMALRQDGALRLMAWSSVAQAGWVVLPMTAVAPGSVTAAGAYVTLYVVGTLAVFVVLAALEDSGRRHRAESGRPDPGLALEDVRGLFRTHPLLAGTLALGLLSLAGLPPSIVGLVAKIVALRPAVTGGLWWLVVIAAVNAVLGIAVYGRWLMHMFRPDDGVDTADVLPRTTRGYTVLATVTVLGLIATSLAPQLLLGSF